MATLTESLLVEASLGRGLGLLLRARAAGRRGSTASGGRVRRRAIRTRAGAGLALDPGRARDGRASGSSRTSRAPAPDRVHRPRVERRADRPSSRSRATATRVTLSSTYRLASGGPLAGVTDRLFVRGQMRGSLRRSLARFRLEAEELAAQVATALRGAAGRGGSSVASRRALTYPRIPEDLKPNVRLQGRRRRRRHDGRRDRPGDRRRRHPRRRSRTSTRSSSTTASRRPAR